MPVCHFYDFGQVFLYNAPVCHLIRSLVEPVDLPSPAQLRDSPNAINCGTYLFHVCRPASLLVCPETTLPL
ncbi:hypothetical protein DPEC_G00306510 [Dallia pectoralis]|uniref:Uncharacterized protein n=1 Tax=Dallia pectoralis TaxID=75939 RepID=A0ACC2FE42_DALPE|nr:hypothetical protein DPEC_G00306510 [Dallia pectoralis]